MSGYSGTPLSKKLGIKTGMTVWTANAPGNLPELLAPMPDGVELSTNADRADIAVVFAVTRPEVSAGFSTAMELIPADGAIWVAWPKRSSGVDTDLTEDTMRELFLPTGLVDNKVCAIDETWSGLRFVVRREHRADWPR